MSKFSSDAFADYVPVELRHRHDGWTPARQVAFVRALAVTGSVTRAAAAAGMSREGAYRLRARPGHADFAAAWDRAVAARKGHTRSAKGHIHKAGRGVISPRKCREGHRNGQTPPHPQLRQPVRARAGFSETSAYDLFTLNGHKEPRSEIAMAEHDEGQAERRRVNRTALHLTATVRNGTRSRVQARVIDISTHGCRIECPSIVTDDSWIGLSIAGLETQYCRVAWHCEEFVGLEFGAPLSEAVFERLLQDQKQLPETAINDLRNIAGRTNWLARQTGNADIAILADLSRKCAVDAVVEGLRLSKPKERQPTKEPSADE